MLYQLVGAILCTVCIKQIAGIAVCFIKIIIVTCFVVEYFYL